MIKKLCVAIFSVFILASCATEILKSYVGKDVREVMLEQGPPVNAFDMGDGRRAFQWATSENIFLPGQTTTSTSVVNGWITTNTSTTPSQNISYECIYTVFAKWDAAKKGWIVVGYQEPSFECL